MMSDSTLARRHDRVHVAPDATLQVVTCGDPLPQALAVRAWLAAGRPLVAARQPGGADGHVMLGLALPPGSTPRRIGVRVPAASIRRVEPPLPIATCAALLPPVLRQPLLALGDDLGAGSIRLGVYGSLAWQASSGLAYWRGAGSAPSDIDLVCDLAGAEQVGACLRGLAALDAAAGIRIDGEIRLGGTRAVAWRELLGAHGRGDAQVLVKGDRRVWLCTADEFLAGQLTREAADVDA